ncbi:MAG: hypothetical protein ABL308_01150 [Oceanicaulis sp.]
MMQKALLVAVLGVFLAVSVWFASRAWFSVDAELTGHGWFALALGVVLSFVVGGGLMWLLFYSSRSGRDDIDQDF